MTSWSLITKRVILMEKTTFYSSKNQYETTACEVTVIQTTVLLNSEIYPTDQQFKFKPVTCSVIRRIIMAMPETNHRGRIRSALVLSKIVCQLLWASLQT